MSLSIRSSIDLGTNTCLLLVAEWDSKNGIQRVLTDQSTIVRLGQGVDQNRKLHPDAKKRTFECLEKYANEIERLGGDPSKTVCIGTSQARDAEDAKEFFSEIQKQLSFEFRVLSGDEEARATFEGALLPGMDPNDYAVIDIGGGSTEYMASIGGFSLDLGSVRMTERYLKSDPVTDEEFWICKKEIDQILEPLKDWKKNWVRSLKGLAVAGTATTLAAWHLNLEKFDPDKIHQVRLTTGDLHRMVEELKWRSVDERKKLTGIEEKRADVLLAGAMILWRSMEVLKFSDLQVSCRGLRYAVIGD